MKIAIISDTHNKHKQLNELPDADVIVHCGDISSRGYEHEIRNFLIWFSNLNQYKHKIFIAGNHDFFFETNGLLAKELIPENVIYLEDSEIVIDGIKFYGSPVSKPFNDWAFNRPESKLKQYWQAIPDDVDVLITHTPPYSICDYVPYVKTHEGSQTLYDEIFNRIKPKINCFGNIHEGRGIHLINDITFINASNLTGSYELMFKPILVELIDGVVKIINY